jgi:hypothetical protein
MARGVDYGLFVEPTYGLQSIWEIGEICG